MSIPWYKEGLYFSCTECGKCCTGAPGYVWLSEKDIQRMSEHLSISRKEFLKMYTRSVNGKIALLENPKNYDCVFLRDNKCQLYGARPKQCKNYPFWPENLKSEKDWETQKRYCEGIDHPEAKYYSLEEIQKISEE